MTREPFRRLALMAASSLWVAAIAAAWLYIDWLVAAAAVCGGIFVAAVLTVEPSQPSRDEVREPVVSGEGHREIARRARRAQAADDG